MPVALNLANDPRCCAVRASIHRRCPIGDAKTVKDYLVTKQGRTADGGRGAAARVEMQQLRAENERLRRKLAKAETIIEVQGKVQALLGELSKSADTDEPSS